MLCTHLEKAKDDEDIYMLFLRSTFCSLGTATKKDIIRFRRLAEASIVTHTECIPKFLHKCHQLRI